MAKHTAKKKPQPNGSSIWLATKKIDGHTYQKSFGRTDGKTQAQADAAADAWVRSVQEAYDIFARFKEQAKTANLTFDAPKLGGTGDDLLEFVKKPDVKPHSIWDDFMEYRKKMYRRDRGLPVGVDLDDEPWWKVSRSITAWMGNQIPETLPTNDVDWADFLSSIRDKIDVRKKADGTDFSLHHKNNYISWLSMFAAWLKEYDYIKGELKRKAEIVNKHHVDPESSVCIPEADLKDIWDASYTSMRAYMCLGLNAGFYEVDIVELTTAMVDTVNKRLFGKRGKTGEPYNFPLWDETLHWMEAMRSSVDHKDANRYFSSKRGGAITSIKINFYNTQRRAWGEVRYSFSNLRDTGATLMELEIDPAFTSQYLRHKITATKKSYTQKTNARRGDSKTGKSPILDAKIMQLRTHFPFIDTQPSPKMAARGNPNQNLKNMKWTKHMAE